MQPQQQVTTLFFTRHSQSLSNQLGSPSTIPANIQPDDFIDCGLSPDGLDNVVYWRNKKLAAVGPCDFIFTSPLKRCIQTTLMTYNKTVVTGPIYVMSLLTEFDKYADCVGRPVADIKRDLDLIAYANYSKLDFNQYLMEYNTSQRDDWFAMPFRYDLHGRIAKIREFFCRPQFTGKKVHVFSHGGVIGNLCGQSVVNYQTVKIVLDQSTGEIISCEFIA